MSYHEDPKAEADQVIADKYERVCQRASQIDDANDIAAEICEVTGDYSIFPVLSAESLQGVSVREADARVDEAIDMQEQLDVLCMRFLKVRGYALTERMDAIVFAEANRLAAKQREHERGAKS